MYSNNKISYDGYVEAKLNTATDILALGLSTNDTPLSRDDIDFCIEANATDYNIYENGVLVHTDTRDPNTTDIMRVRRFLGIISYEIVTPERGIRTIYVSTNSINSQLRAVVSIYTNGGICKDMKFVDGSTSTYEFIDPNYVRVGGTRTSTSVTENLRAINDMQFIAPLDWVQNTIIDSNGISHTAYFICRECVSTTLSAISAVLYSAIFIGNPTMAEGIRVKEDTIFSHVTLFATDETEITTNSKFVLGNNSTNDITSFTWIAGEKMMNIDITPITLLNNQEFSISQITGDEESNIGQGSYIILQ